MKKETDPFICPSELAGSLDNKLRRWVQNPVKILKPYIKAGMTVIDLGCGPGYFTVDIAKMVHESGKVIAADLQEGMLEIVRKKINGTDLQRIVELHKCQINSTGIAERADFILAFWMVHEVQDQDRLFEEFKAILKPEGKICIIEPKIHVTDRAFKKMTLKIISTGFKITGRPKVFFSRSLLLEYNK